MPRIDIKNTIFRLEDGGSNQLLIKVGDGAVTWSEKKPREFLLERGIIDTVRNADEVPMDVNFQLAFEWYTSAPADVNPTPVEALKQTGNASAWVSANPDLCQPYATDLIALRSPTCATDPKEFYQYQQFYYEDIGGDFKAGTLAVTGRCNATEPVILRGNQYT